MPEVVHSTQKSSFWGIIPSREGKLHLDTKYTETKKGSFFPPRAEDGNTLSFFTRAQRQHNKIIWPKDRSVTWHHGFVIPPDPIVQVSISYLHTREGRRADKRRYLYGTGCISSSEFRGLGKKICIVMEGLLASLWLRQ